jgi:hypothetical protein
MPERVKRKRENEILEHRIHVSASASLHRSYAPRGSFNDFSQKPPLACDRLGSALDRLVNNGF